MDTAYRFMTAHFPAFFNATLFTRDEETSEPALTSVRSRPVDHVGACGNCREALPWSRLFQLGSLSRFAIAPKVWDERGSAKNSESNSWCRSSQCRRDTKMGSGDTNSP